MKFFFLITFGRHSKIVKIIAIINFFFNFKFWKALLLLKEDKLNFFFKAIKDKYIYEFYLLKDTQDIIEYFSKKYQFNYDDWFSYNINIWKNYLMPLKEIKYLEIGSFEGRSAVFVGELNNVEEVTCVDTFDGSDEHKDDNFDLVYKNCSENLKKLNTPYNLIKDTSHNFFKKNNKKFNVIYIDGSHFYDDVKKDFINAMNCLDEEGILICDDFLWFYYKKIEDNPIGAILECYENYKNDLEILFINYQIIFKKTKSYSPHIV